MSQENFRANDLNLKTVTSFNAGRAILIWRFEDAPEHFQLLSQNGGDEDYIAFVPDGVEIPAFLEEGSSFGCFKVEKHQVKNGTILIGYHS